MHNKWPYSFDNISPLFMKRLKKADIKQFCKKDFIIDA